MQTQVNSDSTVEFFGLRAAIDTGSHILYSPVSPIDLLLTPISDPVARLTRECSALRLKLATAERKERRGLHKQLSPLPPNTPPSTLNTPSSQLGLRFDSPPGSRTTTVFTYTPPTDSHLQPINSPQPTSPRRTPNPRWHFSRGNKRQRPRNQQQPQSQTDNRTTLSTTTNTTTRPRNITTNERKEQAGMRPAERVRQLEKQLRDVQELLQNRDREIELLKQERDRLFSERDQDKAIEKSKEAERERERVIEKEREKERQHERSLEFEREKERAREREVEKEREIAREREREYERRQQAIREREREQERQREQELQEREREFQRDRERLESDRDQVRASLRSIPDLQLRLPMRPLSTHSSIDNYRDQNNYTPSLRRAKSQIPLSREDSFASTCPPSPLPPPTSHFPQLHVPDLGIDAEQIAQLRSLDVFLTKTDGWSGAQVIQAVEDLNSEITHFAASAVESCVFERRPPNPNLQTLNFVPPTGGGRGRRGKRRGRDSANNSGRSTPRGPPGPSQELLDSVSWLGNTFAKILGSRDHAQDPMLVQLALQSSIATCCARSLALFCTGFPSKLDALLTRVFTHLHAAEPQPTSSRWRSLAHKSIRILYPGLEEYAVTELISTMLKWSSSVFTLCGCSSAPNGTPQTKDIIPQLNSPVLKAQLRRIAEATSKLARVIREDILSTAFEVILVESGNAYDGVGMVNAFREMHFGAHPPVSVNGNGNAVNVNANTLEGLPQNENGNQGKAAALAKIGKVLCTTELGLRCVTRMGKTSIAGEVLDSEGKVSRDLGLMETRVLLPPKVVLDSAVEALD